MHVIRFLLACHSRKVSWSHIQPATYTMLGIRFLLACHSRKVSWSHIQPATYTMHVIRFLLACDSRKVLWSHIQPATYTMLVMRFLLACHSRSLMVTHPACRLHNARDQVPSSIQSTKLTMFSCREHLRFVNLMFSDFLITFVSWVQLPQQHRQISKGSSSQHPTLSIKSNC